MRMIYTLSFNGPGVSSKSTLSKKAANGLVVSPRRSNTSWDDGESNHSKSPFSFSTSCYRANWYSSVCRKETAGRFSRLGFRSNMR